MSTEVQLSANGVGPIVELVMRPMVFQEEGYTFDLFNELLEMAEDHKDEVVPFEWMQVNANPTHYERASELGMLRIYTVRSKGEIVGYGIFNICRHPHFMDTVTAMQDLLYIKPEYRLGSTGKSFILFCEKKLREAGAVVVYQFTGLKRDLSGLFESMGYGLVQKVYAKELKGVI